MTTNIYLKIAGAIFFTVGIVELFERRKVKATEKSEQLKFQNHRATDVNQTEFPYVRRIEPLVRVGQA